MADVEAILYDVAAFVCALFVLEFGADKFVDHTAIVARRTGVSPTVVALLTAGAEYEELAVVVLAIAQHRSSLAVGNIVGSTISNILGAFSLGLLCADNAQAVVFDRSAKLYSALLMVVTTVIAGVLAFARDLPWRALGGVLIAVFAIYLVSIFWAIRKGVMTAPELSDSDSSDDDDDEEARLITDGDDYRTFGGQPRTDGHPRRSSLSSDSTTSGLFPPQTPRHSLAYHLAYLFAGFAALVLSAYVLSHSASSIIAATGISDVLFGVIVLSFATTLPEKLVAVVSGARGHAGVLVANTVGSNIFLLTLCLGVLWAATDNALSAGSVDLLEIGFMLGAALAMTAAVWLGVAAPRLVGALMLLAYVVFIVLEFTLARSV